MATKNALQAALKVLAAAMGGKAIDEPAPIDIKALGKELHTNEKLTAKQYELIQAMDDEQQGMVSVLLEAMLTKTKNEEAPVEEETAEQKAAKAAQAAADKTAAAQAPVVNKALETFMATVTAKLDAMSTEITGLKTNAGKTALEAVKRQDLIARLVANTAVGLTAAELEGMSTDVLAKLESKLRPADYSGQGQFASNANADAGGDQTGADAPLVFNSAAHLLKKPEKKAA